MFLFFKVTFQAQVDRKPQYNNKINKYGEVKKTINVLYSSSAYKYCIQLIYRSVITVK
jgi:hypothetical protein